MITNTCTSGLSRSQSDNRKKTLVQAYGNWLNTLTWDYYCTFTTRYQMTVKSARRTMIKLHSHLNERYNCSAKVFWVAEPFDTKCGCHLHALIEVDNKTSVTKIDLKNAWQHIRHSFSGPMLWNLVAVILLMLVNWSVEAVKWKISIREIQRVSFIKAFKAVLSGVSFSVSMPNRVGEYLGRVMYMDEGNKLKTISFQDYLENNKINAYQFNWG